MFPHAHSRRSSVVRTVRRVVLASGLLATTTALAHQGDHGSDGFIGGLVHLATSADHLMLLVAFGVAGGLIARASLRRKLRASRSAAEARRP